MTKTIVAVVGDLHVNSTVGLFPPRVTLDDGGEYGASKRQKWLWRNWLDFWSHVKEAAADADRCYVVLNGELADDLNHRSTQLVTRNTTDMMRMSIAVLQPALEVGDYFFVTRGTEAHSGPSACLDEAIAEDIGAIPHPDGMASWWSFIGDIGGTRFDIAHHSGHGSRRPWTRGGEANRLAAHMVYRYAERAMRLPDFVLRGHSHNPTDSYDNHPTRAIVLPSWQLTNAFGHKLGNDWYPVGGLYIVLNDGKPEVRKHYYDWPIERDIWTEKKLPSQKMN